MAARCSEVCGWGQDSFPATKKVKFIIINCGHSGNAQLTKETMVHL